ncbi:MAG: helix-turn-helix domain-containing protein, partial [Bauldia sp.]
MTVGVRHDDLRRQNRAMVIAAVRRAGQPSRTEIAAATALSNSTISTISASLIEEGILAEVRAGESAALKRGRPQVALGLRRAGEVRGQVGGIHGRRPWRWSSTYSLLIQVSACT